MLAAPTVSAQLNQPLHQDGWILAAAHAPGLHGSIWRTDLWVYADTNGDAEVTLTLCESRQDNTAAEAHVIATTGGRKVTHVEDVVDHFLSIGGGSWVGAIHYAADVPVQVWARVYSISPDGSASYGQLVEGIPTSDMSVGFDTPGYPGAVEAQWHFAGMHTADGRFRVNVGVVNPTPVAGLFFVTMFTSFGGLDDVVAVEVPPYSMLQLSDPFAWVDGGDWSEKQIRVEAKADGSGAFGYLSVVDNATNDAYFVRGIKRMTYPGP
jgi:hypothetical protein